MPVLCNWQQLKKYKKMNDQINLNSIRMFKASNKGLK